MNQKHNTIEKNFIVFEGCEGSGKSTQAIMLVERLRKEGFSAHVTHEPGGTEYGKRIRQLLITKPSPTEFLTEFLLFEADRAEHAAFLKTQLESGDIWVSDRFSYSTFAYQGYARGLFEKHRALMEEIDRLARHGILPRLIFLLDQPVEIGLSRKQKQQEENRFEAETRAFHERVRNGFLEMAKADGYQTWQYIKADRSIEAIHQEIWNIVCAHLSAHEGKDKQ